MTQTSPCHTATGLAHCDSNKAATNFLKPWITAEVSVEMSTASAHVVVDQPMLLLVIYMLPCRNARARGWD